MNRELEELVWQRAAHRCEYCRCPHVCAGHAPESALAAWKDVVAREIVAEDEDAGY